MCSNYWEKTVICFLVLVIFVFSPRSTQSFTTKQTVHYSWVIDINDIDQSCTYPHERFSFHQLVKAEVSNGSLFVARGSAIPAQLLCISVANGTTAWNYTSEKKWNQCVPFSITDSAIILNFADEIHILSKENGSLQKICKITSAPESLYGIYINEKRLLFEKSDSLLICLDNQQFHQIWTYEYSANSIHRIVGVVEQTVFIVESSDNNTNLIGISLQTGKTTPISQWDSTLLRTDFILDNNKLVVGVLHSTGTATVTEITSTGSTFQVTPLLYDIAITSPEIVKNCSLSLQTELNNLGFRLLSKNNLYYLITSVKQPKKEGSFPVTLSILCSDTKKSRVWENQYISEETATSIVNDAFIQDDFLVFQFPYRQPETMKVLQSFWINLRNGNMAQTFYDSVSYWNEVSDRGMTFLPYTVLFTGTPGSSYLSALAGYCWAETGFFREETTQLNLQEASLQECWTKSFDSEWASSLSAPFEYDHCICFFAWYRNETINEWVNGLFKYDMQSKTILPPIVFDDFVGFDANSMLLQNDRVTTVGYTRNEGSFLACYNLKTGDTLWKKEIHIAYKTGDNFLTMEETEFSTRFSLYNGTTGSKIWTYQFDENNVQYCGLDANGHAYFKRENVIVSQITLSNGILEDELFLSYPNGSNMCVRNNYMLFQIGSDTFQCLFLPTKKVLWTKNLQQYSECLFSKGSYFNKWKGTMISDQELLSYDENGVVVFNLHTGSPTKRFAIEPFFADDIYLLSNSVFVIETKEEAEQLQPKAIYVDLQNADNGTVYEFPEKVNSYDKHWIKGCFVYGGETFFLQHLPNDTVRICSSIVPTAQKEIEPTYLKPQNTNFLYVEDYIIFQATLGSKNSHFYLLAFNTLDGTITPIHKGMHEKFFMHKGMLYFMQYGYYYYCTLGEFQPTPTNYSCADPQFVSETGEFCLPDYQSTIPNPYKVLDLYYINQVLTGNFTRSDVEETLFLTGDGFHSKVGIIDKQDQLFAPVITGSYVFSKYKPDEDRFYTFWQSLVYDVDNDNLDEIVVVGYSKGWGNSIVYIWDYSEEEDCMIAHKAFKRNDTDMPELLLEDNTIYLQFGFWNRNNDYTFEMKQRKLEYHPEKRTKYSMEVCEKELETQLYKKPHHQSLARFQFLEKPVLETEYVTMKPRKTTAFPFVKMPGEYNINKELLTEQEIAYITKRNDYLNRFIKLLDTGKDIFSGIDVNLYGFRNIRSYKLELQKEEDIDFEGNIPINSIDTLFPVTENGKDYLLIRAVDVWDGRHILLFSDQFEFLDILTHGGNDAEYEADCIVSLKHPNHFWLNTSMYRGPYRLCIMNVTNGSLNCVMRFGNPHLFIKDQEPFFLLEDTFHYVDAGGRNSSISGYNYIDPWSGDPINQLFLEEMKQQLDYLYLCYQYYRSWALTPGKISGAGGHIVELEDGRIKYLYTSSAVYILEYFECVFYNYGWGET